MDKNQAVDFILAQYAQGETPEAIAAELSLRLRAPLEMTGKFVQMTLKDAPPPPQPDWDAPGADAYDGDRYVDLDDLDDESPAARETGSARYAGNFYTDEDETDAPQSPAPGYSMQEYATSVFLTGQAPGEQPGAAVVTQLPDGSVLASAAYGVKPGQPSRPEQAEAFDKLRKLEEDPALVKLVIQGLTRTSKQSDVVSQVAEQYALDWKDAQRLVGRVQARNQGRITARQNRILIPLAVLAMAAGGFMLLAGVIEFITLQQIYQSAAQITDTAVLNEGQYFVRRVLPFALSGLALLVGGAIGLFKAISAQAHAA